MLELGRRMKHCFDSHQGRTDRLGITVLICHWITSHESSPSRAFVVGNQIHTINTWPWKLGRFYHDRNWLDPQGNVADVDHQLICRVHKHIAVRLIQLQFDMKPASSMQIGDQQENKEWLLPEWIGASRYRLNSIHDLVRGRATAFHRWFFPTRDEIPNFGLHAHA